jgi:hypothetical protein
MRKTRLALMSTGGMPGACSQACQSMTVGGSVASAAEATAPVRCGSNASSKAARKSAVVMAWYWNR